jgi:hypothetical protein
VPAMTAIQAAVRMVRRRHRRPAGFGRCQEHLGLPFPLVEANAESVTVPDAPFDPLSASTRRAYVRASTLRRGGGSPSPARWTPRVPDQQRPGDGVRAGGRRTLSGSPAAAPTRDVQNEVAWRRDRIPSKSLRLDSPPPRKRVVVEALYELYPPAVRNPITTTAPQRVGQEMPVEDALGDRAANR